MLLRLQNALLALALGLLLAPAIAHAQAAKGGTDDRDMAEIQHYTLSMDKVTRLYQSMADLKDFSKAHPELANKLKKEDDDSSGSGADSLATASSRISSMPDAVSILRKNGFTPHEFLVAEMAVFQSAFAVSAAQQAGTDVNKLAADAHVNPANITFMQQHKDELDALQKKYPGINSND